MSKRAISIGVNIALAVVHAIGLVVFATAGSYARWNDLEPVEKQFNEHAVLIQVCGLAVLVLGVILRSLWNKVERLERQLSSEKERRP